MKVSVIMSVYNDEKYLSEAIESILNQTYTNFEFLIYDDGSTDNSAKIIGKYKNIDNRIKYVTNKQNHGSAYAKNELIKIAKGEYIAVMDSDDIALPTRLEKQIDFLTNNPQYSVVGTNAKYIDEKSIVYDEFKMIENPNDKNSIAFKIPVIHPSVMFTKKAIMQVEGYNTSELTRRIEDYDLMCKFYENGFSFYNIQEFLLYYRESYDTIKKRKYKYRIQEFKVKNYWSKRLNSNFITRIKIFRPLIIGIIPKKIVFKISHFSNK